ncbi:MAG: hypothetical protein ABI137_13020 [Antricoccus sp.]
MNKASHDQPEVRGAAEPLGAGLPDDAAGTGAEVGAGAVLELEIGADAVLESEAVDALDGGVFDVDEAGSAIVWIPDADGKVLGADKGCSVLKERHSARNTVYSAMTNQARSLQRLRSCCQRKVAEGRFRRLLS